MKFGLLIGLVAVFHHANCNSCGCASFGSIGGHDEYHEEHRSGCGFLFPRRELCTKEHLSQADWCDGRDGNKNCVPLVVRPHDLPRPQVNPDVATQLTQVVPNPCAIKKAIVKPAVLPKPVCKVTGQGYGCGGGHGGCGHGGCGAGHSSFGHMHGTGPCYGSGPILPGFHGNQGCCGGLKHGLSGAIGVLGGPVGNAGLGGGLAGPYGRYGFGPLAPADAVSLDIAYKQAREADIRKILSEDRIHFGFRKLPIELPPKKVVQANVPEERIFDLNGQIVELRPVRPTLGNSPAALAEEAAEDLLALEEEEAELAEGPEGLLRDGREPIRRVSLCEIGYGVAKPPKPNFVNVPANHATVSHCDISTTCGCGHYGHGGHAGGGHCGGYACGHVGGCATCHKKCECKIIPGDVEFHTKPKPQQVCLPPRVVHDDCESAELEIEDCQHHEVKCACVPVCVQQHHSSHCCKKSCINVEKMIV